MTHADLAARVADRHGRTMTPEAKAEYVAALIKALDDRRMNRCECNQGGAAR